ncbi:hypothetical protein [Curtobacterium sp. 9128]|uniref:hypothetical protein n=1 Tax=Curtobacterium sp. 9128 TaxID=1793722 RepID=UPI0011A52E76|nr:hypothetical protein [Curtobacterium sp. 9128]
MKSTDEPKDPKQRVAAAKARTQEFERRIVAFVPEEEVTGVSQLQSGSLQSCASGDMWAGGVTIELESNARPKAALSALGEKAEAAGLEVERGKSYNGNERLTVTDAAGVSILLDSADHAIEGGSFSECFSLPRDFYKGGEF